MKIHLQYITVGDEKQTDLIAKVNRLSSNKKLELEIGKTRRATLPPASTLSDKEVLVIDVWVLPNGMYTGDALRLIKNYGEPYAYTFEP